MSDSAEDRFNALYDETRARIVAYVLRRTTSYDDAADVVAETYAIAWQKLDSVPRGESALLWLYVTARYLLSNRSRRLRREDDLVARIAHEIAQVSTAELPQDDDSISALFHLVSLPEDQREILMLAGWEGLDAAALGRVLGCSATAARIRLHRARARLNAEIAESGAAAKHSASAGHEQVGRTPLRCVPGEVQP